VVSKLEQDEERVRDKHFKFDAFGYGTRVKFASKVVLKGCEFICSLKLYWLPT